MAARPKPTTGHAKLERWYLNDLRPKVARAAQCGAICPAQAAAFDLAMATLVRPERGGRDR